MSGLADTQDPSWFSRFFPRLLSDNVLNMARRPPRGDPE